ncbi:hypothetical protein BSL78_24510 [Apostichopus japonicus]|uniref:Uncharacterized protein n=1 Tax=Stichopus japonicus TaxID=307972 RepID=A0A2G8JSB5_STIJA|nr:hypothetical protein BSL78_24510 [Apostichopus japonicus]
MAVVVKEDAGVLQSPGHPDLGASPPATTSASTSRVLQASGERSARAPLKKRKRLSAFDVSQMVVQRNIKTRTELLALAEMQKREGKTDLAEFVVNRGQKCVAEAIEVAWELHDAESKLERGKKSRPEILDSFKGQPCVPGCNGLWSTIAEDILRRNDIPAGTFKRAVVDVLEKGRGKYRNIFITGPANCGKTFILAPLTQIFKVFSNPASTSFAWVGAEKAEVIFLNDFRWSPQIMPWHDLLLLLEGQMVHLPAPKTHFSQDFVLSGSTPVFATGKNPLIYIKGGQIEERETEMMTVRWRYFTFRSQIQANEQVDVPPCGPCFAKFILT